VVLMATSRSVLGYDAIDSTWLTDVLTSASLLSSGRVTEVQRESCGTGLLSDSYRFTLTYDPPESGPASIVGKFASADPTSREYGRQAGQYRNEVCFYQLLAGMLSVAIPTPIYAALADNETDFVLLMDDLAPARVVDQLVGCSRDEAARVMEQAAALHADSWYRSDLAATEWLKNTIRGWIRITDGFDETVATFRDSFGDLIPDSDVAQAAELIPHRDAWKGILSEPRCLWHNDLRADNVLFDAKLGAMPVAVLDWQGVTYARGTLDVAYFLGTSLDTDERRAHERELVAHYHTALCAHGVTGYTAEECWDEYRLLAIHPLQTGVFGLGAVKRSARGDEMWRTWIERSSAMTRDLDSFSLLARQS
jgi:aminoglycoside phosphotransferase (APT) family kinase protein